MMSINYLILLCYLKFTLTEEALGRNTLADVNCVTERPSDWTGKYNGTQNVTYTGKTCKYWKETGYSHYGPENFCRAPPKDFDGRRSPWCYIEEFPGWEYCFIPLCDNVECMDTKITDWRGKYNGTKHVTKNGNTCLYWKNTSYPDYGPNNYCRADNRDADSVTSPWCFVGNGTKEYCSIPFCDNVILGTTCPDLHPRLNMELPVSLSGHKYKETVRFKCHDGYHLDGEEVLTCVVGEQLTEPFWDGAQPTCVKDHKYKGGVTYLVYGGTVAGVVVLCLFFIIVWTQCYKHRYNGKKEVGKEDDHYESLSNLKKQDMYITTVDGLYQETI